MTRFFILISLLLIAPSVVPTPVRASDTSEKYMARRGEAPPRSSYDTALDLMQKGACDQAEQFLGALLEEGPGNAVAHVDMGYCYLLKASQQDDPQAARASRETAMAWILRAANAGQRRAQQELVAQYLDGGILVIDRQEAAKWFLLWKSNRSNFQLAPSEFDEQLEKKLQTSLSMVDALLM